MEQGCYLRRRSLLGTWDSAGLWCCELDKRRALRDIREACSAPYACKESAKEESIDGEVEQTTEHDVLDG